MVPEKRFTKNKMIESLLDARFDKIELDKFTVRRDARQACAEMEETLLKYEKMKTSLKLFIEDYVATEINKVDIAREDHIQKLHKYYGGIVDELSAFKEKCLAAANSVKYSFESFEMAKQQFEEMKPFLDSVEDDKERWASIRNETREMHRRDISINYVDFKHKLLMNKICEYEHEVILIDDTYYNGLLVLRDKSGTTTKMETMAYIVDPGKCFRFCGFDDQSDRFELLYRGSRDGFTTKKFHSKCDGVTNTLTIVRTTGADIFGASTTLPWHADSNWQQDNVKSLMFCYLNDEEMKMSFNDIAIGTHVSCRCGDGGLHRHRGGPMFKSKNNTSFLSVHKNDETTDVNKPKLKCHFASSINLPMDLSKDFDDDAGKDYEVYDQKPEFQLKDIYDVKEIEIFEVMEIRI